MKSIHFCIQEIKEPLLNGSKDQTIRCLMVPKYLPGETVAIKWRIKSPGKKVREIRKSDKFLFYAQIMDIYAKKLREITNEEAIHDGIPDRNHLIKKLMDMHHLKSDEHYCFIIRFRRIHSNTLENYFGR